MKKQWHKYKAVIVLFHLAAWLLLLVVPYFLRPDIPGLRGQPLVSFLGWGSIAQVFFLAAIFYLNSYWLMPRLLNTKRYGIYVTVIIFILGAGLVFYIAGRRYFPPVQPAQFMRPRATELNGMPGQNRMIRGRPPVFPALFSLLFVLVVSIAYRFFLDRLRFERLEQLRQNEHLKSELGFLRSQISPHFIFNMLNSAVALARTQPAQVEPTLLKLSSLMRYMLYDTDEMKVTLKQELEYLEAYVELQRLRFGDTVPIEFSKTGVLFGHTIEPMLLIPFVENAFKHGLGKVDEPRIEILLEEDQGNLTFRVKNKFNPERHAPKDKYSGIGLANVQKRLDILYGADYQLIVAPTGDWYQTILKLPLK